MYFPDLSTYSYEMSNEIPKALNIGWLSEEHPFLTGDVPSGIKAKIRHLCLRYRSPLQHRGYHWCEFCPRQETELRGMRYPTPLEDGVKLGSALVVVPIPKNEEVFVCPDLICHFIDSHRYLPPQQFLDAVDVLNLDLYDPIELWKKASEGRRF